MFKNTIVVQIRNWTPWRIIIKFFFSADYSPGSPISYLNNNGVFKQAGFLVKVTDEYFIYITPDFSQKYRVRFKNVQKMLVGNVHKLNNDLICLTKTKQKKTNFPVELTGIIVYYAQSSFDRTRFINTDRYKRMLDWCNYFGE